MATITVVRDDGLPLMGRGMVVLLNGRVTGRVRHGRPVAIEVTAGRHQVRVALAWQRSATVEVDVEDRERVWLRAAWNERAQTWTGLARRPGEALDLEIFRRTTSTPEA